MKNAHMFNLISVSDQLKKKTNRKFESLSQISPDFFGAQPVKMLCANGCVTARPCVHEHENRPTWATFLLNTQSIAFLLLLFFLLRVVAKLKVWCDYCYQVGWGTVEIQRRPLGCTEGAGRRWKTEGWEWRDVTGSQKQKSKGLTLCFALVPVSSLLSCLLP